MSWAVLLLVAFPRIINDLVSLKKKPDGRVWAYLASVGFGVLTGISIIMGEPIRWVLFAFSESFTFGLSLDPLSGVVSTTVMFIGASVMRFSERYLSDDPHQSQFHRNIATTLTFVLIMLNSLNLLMFWFAWVGTSFYLHKLLLHFSEREGARKAAHEKFWVSRIGDVFILAASGALFQLFGSLDFSVIAQASESLSLKQADSFLMGLAGVFLVLGAMTKSAQFPFHFWLPKTMETPTPVSALMHAGIINAGGFLIIKMGGFLNQIPWTLHLLALVGGFTALFGSFIMLTQTNVKRSLAYSTISQMGFMMLQCGLGAFAIATVHMIGHAFYKAYSFLGSGAVADHGRLNRYVPQPDNEPRVWMPFIAGFSAVSVALLVGPFFGYGFEKPGALILLLVLGLACAQIFLSYNSKMDCLIPILSLCAMYFGLYQLMTWILHGSLLTYATKLSGEQNFVYLIVGSLFILLYLFQNNLNRISKTKFGQKIYLKSLNGGYLG
ncbi:MAG: proton-conducting transporter membrane subunit [Bdellovibrionales bacterium]